jgi:hypothetical protein
MLSHLATLLSQSGHDFYAVLSTDLRAGCDVEVHQRETFENKECYVGIREYMLSTLFQEV